MDLGLQFSPVVKGDLTVHIDANPVVIHKSSRYVQELVGLVVGQGFKAVIKPESWAASHAADHIVRSQGKLPRNGTGASRTEVPMELESLRRNQGSGGRVAAKGLITPGSGGVRRLTP